MALRRWMGTIAREAALFGQQSACVTGSPPLNLTHLVEEQQGVRSMEERHHEAERSQLSSIHQIGSGSECFYNRVRRHSFLGYLSPVAYDN